MPNRCTTFGSAACRIGMTAAAVVMLDLVTAFAQPPALSRTQYTNGASMRRAFQDVVTQANDWTVHIEVDERVVAYGTIVRGDGYILSKASQLHGDLVVQLSDDREWPAEYVGYSPEYDVALLKVSADNLPAVGWHDGDDPQIGAWVITPDQHGAPTSIGVVSVARRRIPRVREAAVLGIRMKTDPGPVIVQDVMSDSAAERAGLQDDDIVLQVDDVDVDSPASMKFEISRHTPGDTIALRIRRNGQEQTLRATLTHPFGEFQSRIAMQNHMGGELSERRSGFPVVLQHDSVLLPHQCGGPLVNLTGHAIGINIARAGRTESYAIPADVLRPLLDRMLSGEFPPPGEQQPTIAAELVDDSTPTPPESDTAGQ